jgi:hypothetical protein
MMGNILGEVAPALRGRVKVVKVDTEKYPTVANQYQIGGGCCAAHVRMPGWRHVGVHAGGRRAERGVLKARAWRFSRCPCTVALPAYLAPRLPRLPPLPLPPPAALPTLILFKNGKPVDRMEGVVGAADLRNRLEYFAAGQPGQQAQQQQASQQQQ